MSTPARGENAAQRQEATSVNPPAAIVKPLGSCPAYRISAQDTNYFAVLFDAQDQAADLVAVVEIFERGGRTPPNGHQRAHEMFYVLAGEGEACAGHVRRRLAQGDAMMIRPGTQHEIENVGPGKLYCLTLMVPDEAFAALIRAGIPVKLDPEDIEVLGGSRIFAAAV